MGSFTGKLDALTLAFADYLNRSERDRLIAVLVTQGAGEAKITLALATPDLRQFFIYNFSFDYSEATHSQLKELCRVLVDTIDSKLIKNAEIIDIQSDAGMRQILGMYESQLNLLGEVRAKNHWEAVKYRLSLIADGQGLNQIEKEDRAFFIDKAKELLGYLK